MSETKKGYKTSEFWLSSAALVIGAFLASGAVADSHWAVKLAGVVMSALAAAGYTYSRTRVKELE